MISREKLQFIMMVMKNTNSIKATAKAVGVHRNTDQNTLKACQFRSIAGKGIIADNRQL
jgi:transposase-like protein